MNRDNSTNRWASFAFLALASLAAPVILFFDSLPPPVDIISLGLVLFLLLFVSPGSGSDDPAKQRLKPPATPLVVLVGALLFFRLSYFWELPLGYWDENLFFAGFAKDQLSKAPSYVPYAGYFHTLLGYCVAVVSWLTGIPEIDALRITCALIGSAAVLALYACGTTLFGWRAGFFAAAALCGCFFYLWTSRNGWQKLFMPLLQAWLLYSFYLGIARKARRGFLYAALCSVLILHAYWGAYISLGLWFLSLAYLLWKFHGDERAQLVRSWGLGAVCFLALSLPILVYFISHPGIFAYPFAKRSESPFPLGEALWRNFTFVLWALSGNSAAGQFAPYTPLTTPVAGILALIGACLSLRKIRQSTAHFLLWGLTALNLAGLAYTGNREIQFVVALFCSFYLYVGLALDTLARQASTTLGRDHNSPVGATLALCLVFGQMTLGYQEYFHGRMVGLHQTPSDQAFALRRVIEPFMGTSPTFAPRGACDRDFGSPLDEIASRGFSEFEFVSRLGEYNDNEIVLPRALASHASSINFILPGRSPILENYTRKIAALFPGVVTQSIYFPEPHRQSHPELLAAIATLPTSELGSWHGLSLSQDSRRARGTLYIPKDGIYGLRASLPWTGTLRLGPREPLAIDDSQKALPLERGYYPLEIDSPLSADLKGLTVFRDDGWEQPLDSLSLHGLEKIGREAPLESPLGRFTDDAWVNLSPALPPIDVRGATLGTQSNLFVLLKDQVQELSEHGALINSLGIPTDKYARVSVIDGRPVVASRDGAFLLVDFRAQSLVPWVTAPCPIADFTTGASGLTLLCLNGSVQHLGGKLSFSEIFKVEAPYVWGQSLSSSLSITEVRGGYAILDAVDAQLSLYSPSGTRRTIRYIDDLCWPFHRVQSDKDATIFIGSSRSGMRIYSAEGERMFSLKERTPAPLYSSSMSPFGGSYARTALDYQASGDRLVLSGYGAISVYQRTKAAPPGGQR